MGFFKDISTLNKMGKDMRKDWDPVAQMAQAQASMVQTNAMLADMAARAGSAAATSGTPASASVVGVRQTGQFVNMQPVLAIDLLVQSPGGFPTPVTINEIVAQIHLARLQPGASLAVKVGATPHDVVIDWSAVGSPAGW